MKIPKQAAVSFVADQSNFPAPKAILTRWALKRNEIALMGIIKKTIWRKTEENFKSISFFSPLEKANDIAGKTAIAKGTATSPIIGKDKSLAKLKIPTLPGIKVEPIMVKTTKLIWLAAKPIALGTVNFKVNK